MAPGSKYNHNNSLMVKNIHGTSADRYHISGLSQKFVAAGGTSSTTCQAKGCSNQATATAHVIKTDGRRDNDWHLTRLCHQHNHYTNDEPIPLRKNANVVSVQEVRKL